MAHRANLLKYEPGAEVLLVDLRDRQRIRRLHRLQIGAWIMLAITGLGASVVFSMWPRQFAENPWIGGIGVGAIIVVEMIALLLGKRVVLLRSPLTRRELNTYPGVVATQIRLGLAALMPEGIGEGQCCPQTVALDRRLHHLHEDCWSKVIAARGAEVTPTGTPQRHPV